MRIVTLMKREKKYNPIDRDENGFVDVIHDINERYKFEHFHVNGEISSCKIFGYKILLQWQLKGV